MNEQITYTNTGVNSLSCHRAGPEAMQYLIELFVHLPVCMVMTEGPVLNSVRLYSIMFILLKVGFGISTVYHTTIVYRHEVPIERTTFVH